MQITWDLESNNLLNDASIDYTASPYKLKDTFKLHCIVVEEIETGVLHAFYDGPTYILDGRRYEEGEGLYILENYTPTEYIHHQLSEFKDFIITCKPSRVVGHNIINFDMLVCKLLFGMDYTVEEDTWCGNSTDITDTLILSKVLNPDRFGGHSLDNLSKIVKLRKIDFRPHIHKDKRYEVFAADMLYYNIIDVRGNTKVAKYLDNEAANWDWADSISLEKSVMEIITRQEHRGFKFNKELAETNIAELDRLMEERRAKVEPILPMKKATKGYMMDFTPPVRQFLKSGELSSYSVKFADKIGAKITGEVGDWRLLFNGEEYKFPLPLEPLITTQAASIGDTTHIKEWLVSEFSWQPLEYKDRDLSVNSKKEKLVGDKFMETIDRYVEQTLCSPFMKDRCEFLETTPSKLKSKILSYKPGRAIKVLTNPSFTVGQDKEICPNLELLADKFPYAKDIVEYLTYKHRRNSILGGGLEWEDEDDAEKGYLASVREDGRIPTPADTCGAGTSRFKHRLVANIPRVTSLFGEQMRGLFGVDEGFLQIGYDFDSLEAREEAHYCFKHEREVGKPYCDSLLQSKPNDVHSVLARKISTMIGKEFERGPAKSVKYGATYGAMEPRVAKIIGSDLATGTKVFNAFWQAALPLKKLKDALKKYWEGTGQKKFVLGIDGRKVPTRSAHAILNSLFQSAGVICAKRAMVIHDRKLKSNGLFVDFFKDDWRSKQFCQQLIAYHDEAQLEVSRSLVKLKSFKDKESAATWKEAVERDGTRILSDIGHKGDIYYVGYCLAGQLAVESVKEAGEYYKLNVDLTAGYMIGDSWGSCH